MAALTAVTRLLRSGQRVLSGDDIYGACMAHERMAAGVGQLLMLLATSPGGTSRLLSQVLPKQGTQRCTLCVRACCEAALV
jgi:hypothetical protein